jgi:putative N6-adenine-specific DNA methylase
MTLTDKLFITCPRGLEEPLSNEISALLGLEPIIDAGGVHIKGSDESIYKLNLSTRTSMLVLQEITSFKSTGIEDLYKKVKSYPWHKLISSSDTFSIRSKINSRLFQRSNILTLKVKDAIVDRIRMESNSRPSIDKEDPTYPIILNIKDNKVIIYLNTSGSALYIRGYRGRIHRASMNPCLAAGLVLLSNWDQKSPFYDPMCGSGTIPIEALMIASSIPPRIARDSYAFKKWKSFDPKLFNRIKKESIERIKPLSEAIYASDNTMSNIDLTKQSLLKINQVGKITLGVLDIGDFETYTSEGTIIMNPPHGHRMSQTKALEGLYRKIGDRLKSECAGHNAYIFCMNNNLPKSIGLRTKRKFILKNGKLDCRLLFFPMSEGKFA